MMNKLTQIIVWLMLVAFIWDYATRPDVDALNIAQRNAQSTPATNSVGTADGVLHSYAPIVKDVLPKVVSVYTESVRKQPQQHWFLNPFSPGNSPSSPAPTQATAGSGVIVSDQGHIITNYHVINGADVINVRYLGEEVVAEVISFDEGTDLALLKIDKKTQPIIFSDSDKVNVGDVVLAIGNPFNVGETVSQGIVSALGRNLMINAFEDYIQTDAAINTGNSGGALINTAGELVGINSVIISNSGGFAGVAFAISSNLTYDIFMQLLKNGKVVRGYFGVVIRSDATGVFIENIAANTGAAVSGLRIGDKIVAIGGVDITDSRQMVTIITEYKPQDKVSVTLERGGRREVVEVVVSERPNINRP